MVYKKDEVRRIVLKYAKELQKRITVKKIILFGSYAYGNPTKSSDIDIAVISDRFKKMDDITKDYAFIGLCKTHKNGY